MADDASDDTALRRKIREARRLSDLEKLERARELDNAQEAELEVLRESRREAEPGELLFEFERGHDRFLCELHEHGPYGVEAQFYQNEEYLFGRRFDSRELAVQWAEEERKVIETAD